MPGAEHDLRRAPRTSGEHDYYHLSEDLADDAIDWLRRHKAFQPDKPFFMYWAQRRRPRPAPHHEGVGRQVQGQVRRRLGQVPRARLRSAPRHKGWIPARRREHAAARPTWPSWDSIPEAEKPFQRRLMEVYAGFAEHADHEVGRLVDEIEQLGYGDNTLIFYIWGDNGSSAEGQNGTISELLAQNGIPTTIEQHIKALERTRRPRRARLAQDRQHVPRRLGLGRQHALQGHQAAWPRTSAARATRWPSAGRRRSSPTRRRAPQFHHVNDIVPTHLRDRRHHAAAGGQRHPAGPDRRRQLRLHVRRRRRPRAASARSISRSWAAAPSTTTAGWRRAFGPRTPWVPGLPKGIREWTPDKDKWELYNLDEDWSQANDLADKMPEKLAEMKDLFLIEFAKNKGFPIGGGLWVPVLHPELRKSTALHRMDLPRRRSRACRSSARRRSATSRTS